LQVYEAIASELFSRGIRKCFGLIGEDVAELVIALHNLGVDYHSARHETSAIAMADGYSRASSTVGVAIVSKGPGLINALNGLVTAAKGDSSILLIVADTSVTPSTKQKLRKGKYIDQVAVLSAAGVQNVTLRSPQTAVADTVTALKLSQSGVSVVVNIPDSVFYAPAGSNPSTLQLPPLPILTPPDPAVITDVAELIETTWAASRPVILAGRGAVRAGARGVLERLGDICGAFLTSTLLANGMFEGSPYNLGIMGTLSTPLAAELLAQADLLLVFGAALGAFTTYGGEIAPRARIVQFDKDAEAFDLYPYAKPEIRVLGDAKLAATALVEELERRGHQSEGFRRPDVVDRVTNYRGTLNVNDESDEYGLDPRSVLFAIDKILPADRVIVTDSGHHMNFEAEILRPYDASSWIFPCDFSSIGSATGVAVGASIARPNRLTVLCVGDGGFIMTIGEIATAVRYNVRLLVLVNNDAAYGSDYQLLKIGGASADMAQSDRISFEAIATGMGAQGMTIKTIDDVAELASKLKNLSGPLVVDYKVTTSVQADALRLYFKLGRQSGR
jgi:thiamine pyrophosphate-dependent acetolactate synthase large subunit-like protein